MPKGIYKRKIRPIRIDGDLAYISLTQGYEAVIDVADVSIVEDRNWCFDNKKTSGYAVSTVCKKDGKSTTLLLHRLLMNPSFNLVVDHIDGNGLNNRRSNLRICSTAENSRNQRIKLKNTSGFKGVSWHKRTQKWQSHIRRDGKGYNLGHFNTPEDAYAAYCQSSDKLHGEFGRVS